MGKEGFDTKVHIRDPKTGAITKQNHYVLHVSKTGTYYERDGVQYFEDGSIKRDRAAPVKKQEVQAEKPAPAEKLAPAPEAAPEPKVEAAPELPENESENSGAKDQDDILAEKLGIPSEKELAATAKVKQVRGNK